MRWIGAGKAGLDRQREVSFGMNLFADGDAGPNRHPTISLLFILRETVRPFYAAALAGLVPSSAAVRSMSHTSFLQSDV